MPDPSPPRTAPFDPARKAAKAAVPDAVGAVASVRTLGTKVGVGLLGAALVGGAVLVGAVITADLPGASAPMLEPDVDEGITGVDFANVTVTPAGGEEYRLVDGVALQPGLEDVGVGYHLAEGPVFADVDGDNDLDAAVLLSWRPAAGATTHAIFVWLWNEGRAEQVVDQVESEYHGHLAELTAVDAAFRVDRTAPAPDMSESTTESILFGMRDGDVVRLDPLSAVTPCSQDTGMVSMSIGPDVDVRVAPHGEAESVEFAWTDGHSHDGDLDGDGWVLARLHDDSGATACGWVRLEDVRG
ncbi:MAG TPA: hypothetical protein H9881_10385 [Candidatus Stackebrandtia excrementipullorum]|nr:hypothetical protein [Candidatus Stackebrandtia excrementipullorum]